MKKLFKTVYGVLQDIYKQLIEEQRVKYRLIELSIKKQEVVLNVKRCSLILKYNFADVIKEIWIIEALSTEDAALLGYFYGRCYRLAQVDTKSMKRFRSSPLSLKKNKGRYKILYHYRDGNISYIDCRNQQEFFEHPQAIMRNSHVINNFDSTQACYIGILAGLSHDKIQTKNLKPSLRVID